MSTISLEAVDASALNSSDLKLKDFSLEILNSKPFYLFEVPRYILDTTIKAFSVGDRVISSLCKGCEKIANAENLVALFQDVISLPEQLGKLKSKVVGCVAGDERITDTLNQARKFIGYVGSTLGDYCFSCEALKELKVPVDKIHVVSEKAGLYGSSVGAASRVFDYVTGDFDQEAAKSYPVAESIRQPILDSRRAWDCARDVSILALGVLGIGFGGVAQIPSIALVGFSGAVLGARLISVYKDMQLKKIDDANPYKSNAIKELIK